jgi:hypothetical protein
MADIDREVLELEDETKEILSDEEAEEAALVTLAEVQAVIRQDIKDAVDYLDEISAGREKAARFYDREPFGDEQEGRSAFISADVHDTIRGIMPDLLRIFFGSEQSVEFLPTNPSQIQQAEQITDYVNKAVLKQDNCGFLVAHSAFHDALLKNLGVIKWAWEDLSSTTEILQYTGITPDVWALIEMDPNVQVIESYEDQRGDIAGTIRRTRTSGRVRLDAVPPEELLSDRDARDLDTCRLIGHRTSKMASELVEMGFEWDEIEPHLGSGEDIKWMRERQARDKGAKWPESGGTGVDEATSSIMYTEVYRFFDYDGDGRAELRRFCCLGRDFEIARNDEWDERPFALFGPDPTPHSLIGGSVADLVKDIQQTKSRLVRAMLDSLGKAVDPKQVFLDGAVNPTDVMNTNIGGAIREYAAGAYRIVEIPFVGGQALPVLQYMDQVKVQRTGNLDAGKALTADVLQSTTAQAVEMAHDNSKAQVEMIAKIFAETGWKRLFKGILKTLVQHQDMTRTVRLRGGFVPINPQAWDAGLDVTVNVALGSGTVEQRGAILGLLAAKQEQIMAQMGFTGPLFTLQQYGNTLRKIAELGGIHDTDNYVGRVPADWAPPPPPEKPDPSLIVAQAEMMKAENEKIQLQVETSVEYQKALLTDNRERDRMELEALLKAWEIETKVGTTFQIEQIKQIAQSVKESNK